MEFGNRPSVGEDVNHIAYYYVIVQAEKAARSNSRNQNTTAGELSITEELASIAQEELDFSLQTVNTPLEVGVEIQASNISSISSLGAFGSVEERMQRKSDKEEEEQSSTSSSQPVDEAEPDESDLHTAIKKSSVQLVKQILEISPEKINTVDNQGRTALHLIALLQPYYGHYKRLEIARCILKHSYSEAIINHVDDEGSTALHLAVVSSNSDFVRLLIQHKASSEIPDSQGYTPIQIAEKYENEDIRKLFLPISIPVPISVPDGNIDLRTKVYNLWLEGKFKESVELIFHRKRDLEKNKENLDELLSLALNYHYQSKAIFIDYGDGILEVFDGPTMFSFEETIPQPIGCSSIKEDEDIEKNYKTLQRSATLQGNIVERVHLFIQNPDLEINKLDEKGQTVLHLIAIPQHYLGHYKRLEMARRVLENPHGKRIINHVDNEGFTPLHLAVISNNLDLIRFLIRYEANPNIGDNQGHTPLHLASSNKYFKVVEYLLENCKIDVNVKDNRGCTSLHLAITSNNNSFDLVRLLIQYDASLDIADSQGRIALHWAAECENFAIVSLLLSDKGYMPIQDVNGTTPLELAVEGKFQEIVHLLWKRRKCSDEEESLVYFLMYTTYKLETESFSKIVLIAAKKNLLNVLMRALQQAQASGSNITSAIREAFDLAKKRNHMSIVAELIPYVDIDDDQLLELL